MDSLEVPPTNMENLDHELLHNGNLKKEDIRLFDLTNEKAVANSGLKNNRWRIFKLQFLEDIGIKLAYVRKILPDGSVNDYGRWYMYLPIDIRGKTRGYIKAQIEKPKDKGIPSYINSHGSWSLKQGLFPYDHVIHMLKQQGVSTVALVEGPRDALRLIRNGIPALCIVGTHSWSKSKIRLLEMAGISRIILMMDGDVAGRKATKMIMSGLGPDGQQVCPPLPDSFFVKVVRLWLVDSPDGDMKYDPGNCPLGIVQKVKKLVR